MFKTEAIVHSLNSRDEVTILHKNSDGDVVAEYNGIRYTAIYNTFAGAFYVDDIYGELIDQHYCPKCGVCIP